MLSPAVFFKQLIYSVLTDCSALQLFVLGFASSGHAAFAIPLSQILLCRGQNKPWQQGQLLQEIQGFRGHLQNPACFLNGLFPDPLWLLVGQTTP